MASKIEEDLTIHAIRLLTKEELEVVATNCASEGWPVTLHLLQMMYDALQTKRYKVYGAVEISKIISKLSWLYRKYTMYPWSLHANLFMGASALMLCTWFYLNACWTAMDQTWHEGDIAIMCWGTERKKKKQTRWNLNNKVSWHWPNSKPIDHVCEIICIAPWLHTYTDKLFGLVMVPLCSKTWW